ncbi:MAG: endolytic transglycosylase MltG [Clostridia bacterium]|nr:endolytic transglycosylase MltG [Clostridia bacterium]
MGNPDKSKKNLVKNTASLVVIAIIVFVVSAFMEVKGIGGEKKVYEVHIPNGAGSSAVAEILKERGIISFPLVFKIYTRLGDAPVYQKGGHNLSPDMSYEQIIAKLESAPDFETGTKKIVIPEGFELRQIVDLLVEKGLGTKDGFTKEIEKGDFGYDFVNTIGRNENRLEGYLYPDTYFFSVDETEHQIIDKMLSAFNEKVVPVYNSVSTPYSLDQIVTMASVIEREAANDEERPLVASVFYNRIANGMKLESCATVQYILKERKEILSRDDTAIDSPYNTYMYEGMPAGPIASPGLSSIKAALEPADTSYYYFLATSDGEKNLFSETFEEHNRKLVETQGE